VNVPLRTDEAGTVGSREGFWRYLRQVYCTQEAYSNSAFDAGLEGGRVEMFEKPWKTWTASFAH